SSDNLILDIGSVTDMTPGVSEVVVRAAFVKVEEEEKVLLCFRCKGD
nr:hypothetical protein [Tanacetum cinerariifolium]